MPVVRIDYEKTVSEEEIKSLAEALRPIVADAGNLPVEDVCVFAQPNYLTIGAAPIEIYVQAGPGAIPDGDKEKMVKKIATEMRLVKEDKKLTTLLNISVVQMDWKFELEV